MGLDHVLLEQFLGILRCADYWFARYQSVFVGLIALSIAFRQMKIATRQNNIAQEQHKMSQDQKATDVALSIVALDPFISDTVHATSMAISQHDRFIEADDDVWSWGPEALDAYAEIKIPVGIEGHAAKAFPDLAPQIVMLASLIVEAQGLANSFVSEPWANPKSIAGETPRGKEMTRKTDRVLNRIFSLSGDIAHIQAHVRRHSAD